MKKLISVIWFVVLITTNVWALDKTEGTGLQVDVLTQATSSWDGSPLPNYPIGTAEITIMRITIAPGAQLPVHEHTVINAGVLLKGELTVITRDNKTLHLKAGEPVVEVVGKWHYGMNEGTEPAEIIVFYAGEEGQPNTVKQ